jgi:hypothetical protein
VGGGGFDFFDPTIALRCGQDNLRGQKNLGPLEKPLEIADYVFCPHRKITRTIRISGASYTLNEVHVVKIYLKWGSWNVPEMRGLNCSLNEGVKMYLEEDNEALCRPKEESRTSFLLVVSVFYNWRK